MLPSLRAVALCCLLVCLSFAESENETKKKLEPLGAVKSRIRALSLKKNCNCSESEDLKVAQLLQLNPGSATGDPAEPDWPWGTVGPEQAAAMAGPDLDNENATTVAPPDATTSSSDCSCCCNKNSKCNCPQACASCPVQIYFYGYPQPQQPANYPQPFPGYPPPPPPNGLYPTPPCPNAPTPTPTAPTSPTTRRGPRHSSPTSTTKRVSSTPEPEPTTAEPTTAETTAEPTSTATELTTEVATTENPGTPPPNPPPFPTNPAPYPTAPPPCKRPRPHGCCWIPIQIPCYYCPCAQQRCPQPRHQCGCKVDESREYACPDSPFYYSSIDDLAGHIDQGYRIVDTLSPSPYICNDTAEYPEPPTSSSKWAQPSIWSIIAVTIIGLILCA